MSEKKRRAAVENLRKATAANRVKHSFGIWKCSTCKKEAPATVHQMRKTYCSKECMAEGYRDRMLGSSNPNFKKAGWRICETCQKEFHSYNKDRRYCSLSCRDQGADQLRTNAKKDSNHNEIVDLLTAGGAEVKDMSRAMFGVPDLLVWHRNRWTFVEVKNPKTSYGKKGLNASQEKWAKDWKGGAVVILRTAQDVEKFLAWDLDALERVGGYVESIEETN